MTTGSETDSRGAPRAEAAVAAVAKQLVGEARVTTENIDRRTLLIGELVLACQIAHPDETEQDVDRLVGDFKIALEAQGADPKGVARIARMLDNGAVLDHITSLRFVADPTSVPGVRQMAHGMTLDTAAFVDGILGQAGE